MSIKKIFLALIAITAFTNIFAQTFKTEEEAYTYFKNNLLAMDKVEGVFKCTSYQQTGNGEPQKMPLLRKTIIVKDGEMLKAYWLRDNSREVNPMSFMQILKRDYINTYDVILYGQSPKPIEFIDENSFKVKKEKKDKASDGITESYFFERVFPTQADIDKERLAHPTSAKCTGFLISGNLMVTNLHILENAKSIKVKGVRGDFGNTYNAVLSQSDKNNDLAILSFEDPTIKIPCPITLNNVPLEAGKDVYVLAYPLTAATGDEVKLTNGMVSSKMGFQGDIAGFQINVPSQLASVGGPVFDKNGALVGIIGANKGIPETSSLCTKTSYLKSLIDALPVKVKLPAANALAAKPLTEKVKTLSKLVYIVEVEY